MEMTKDKSRSGLTALQRSLLELFRRIGFGRVHRLQVRGGQPVLDTDLRWTRVVKTRSHQQPPPFAAPDRAGLRAEEEAFLRLMAAIGDGEVRDIEVFNGVPDRFSVDEGFAA